MARCEIAFPVLAIVVCLLVPWLAVGYTRISGTADGSEQWDYVDVRPGAHMFWWWYRSTSQASSHTVPVTLWLQGGPGGFSVGVGDFQRNWASEWQASTSQVLMGGDS